MYYDTKLCFKIYNALAQQFRAPPPRFGGGDRIQLLPHVRHNYCFVRRRGGEFLQTVSIGQICNNEEIRIDNNTRIARIAINKALLDYYYYNTQRILHNYRRDYRVHFFSVLKRSGKPSKTRYTHR